MRGREGNSIIADLLEVMKVDNCIEYLCIGEEIARLVLHGVLFPYVFQSLPKWLGHDFEVELVWALEGWTDDKAPGSYGFNFSYVKADWGFLGQI